MPYSKQESIVSTAMMAFKTAEARPQIKAPFRLWILWGLPLSLILTPLLVRYAGSVETLAHWSPLCCPLQKFLQLSCPTCGLTRSLIAAWNGQWTTAAHHHFLGPLLLVLSCSYWLATVFSKDRELVKIILALQKLKATRSLFSLVILAYTIWGFFLR